MSEAARPRGLGRGLSALLGEPMRPEPTRPAPPALAPAPPATDSVVRPFAPVSLPEPPPAPAPSPSPEPPMAIEPPAGEQAEEGKAAPLDIGLQAIEPNPNQPRRHFDETELAELAHSIRTHGVLQPILVRPKAGEPGRFEIVAGERRWRAAARAERATIPAMVRDLNDSEVLEIAIIENVQRTDLNPIEEAQGFQALMDRFGRTQQDVAEAVGKSRSHVANTLRLLQLPADIQDMVRDGSLSAGHARAILTAPDPLALAKLALSGGLSVREIERLAARSKDRAAVAPSVEAGPEKSEKDPDLLQIEDMLSRALGLPVSIHAKGEGSGEVRISYRRAHQLDELCRKLSAG